MPYSVEEILGDDGQTVSSLVVRFTLPEHVKNADDGIQLLFEPDAAYTGGALAVKSADANGELQQRCRVGLPITVDPDGTQAKFRKKMRTLFVTMPVQRDPSVTTHPRHLRQLVAPGAGGASPGPPFCQHKPEQMFYDTRKSSQPGPGTESRDDRDDSRELYYASSPLPRAVLGTDFRILGDPHLRNCGGFCAGRRELECETSPRFRNLALGLRGPRLRSTATHH